MIDLSDGLPSFFSCLISRTQSIKQRMTATPHESAQSDGDFGDQQLSLDQLSQAFAEVLRRDATHAPTSAEPTDDGQHTPEPAGAPDAAGHGEVSPAGLVEAILFVGSEDNQPVSNREIAAQIRGVSPREVDQLVVQLNECYAAERRPYAILSEGSGYRMGLRDEYASVRERFYGRIREARLSQVAIDVLAIVAYKPGLTRTDIDQLRGKPTGSILSQLVRRHLLRIERDEQPPRHVRYFTTQRFLDLFGLQNLDDLPRSQDDRIL